MTRRRLLLLLLLAAAATAQRLDDPTKLTTAGPPGPGGRRDPRFLLGYNLGNVRLLPFARAPLAHTPDELRSMLLDALDDMADAGANAVRFWLHIDGSTNPEWSPTTGLVSGLSLDTVNDLKWFLQAAADRGLAVVLSLWSHDMLAVRATNSAANRDRALRVVEDEAALDAYIRNALVPLLQDLGGSTLKGAHAGATMLDAVWAWETMNEPEGMSPELEFYKNYMYILAPDGNYTYENPPTYDAAPKRAVDYQNISFLTTQGGYIGPLPGDPSKAAYAGPHFLKTEGGSLAGLNEPLYRDVFAQFNSDFPFLIDQVQNHGLTTKGATAANLARFHNRIAGAIHRAAPGALVTAAAHSMNYVCGRPDLKVEPWRPPARNLYADDVLVAAGGDADGTLDFYQVHTYPVWSDAKDEYNAWIMPFARPKSFWQLDKPLLVGEFWNAVGGAGEGSLTADAWYRLFEDGYAGGLGWAYFEVAEEFGASLPSPARTLRKHQMRDAFRPLIRGVADRLATARRAAAAAAVARPVDRTLAASKAAAVAAAASPAHFGGVGAAATPRHPTTKARAVVDKSVAAPAPAPAVAAQTVAAALAGPAPAAPPFPSPALTTADTTTDGAIVDVVDAHPALADAVADAALALARDRGADAAAAALLQAAAAAAVEVVAAGGDGDAAVDAAADVVGVAGAVLAAEARKQKGGAAAAEAADVRGDADNEADADGAADAAAAVEAGGDERAAADDALADALVAALEAGAAGEDAADAESFDAELDDADRDEAELAALLEAAGEEDGGSEPAVAAAAAAAAAPTGPQPDTMADDTMADDQAAALAALAQEAAAADAAAGPPQPAVAAFYAAPTVEAAASDDDDALLASLEALEEADAAEEEAAAAEVEAAAAEEEAAAAEEEAAAAEEEAAAAATEPSAVADAPPPAAVVVAGDAPPAAALPLRLDASVGRIQYESEDDDAVMLP